MTARDEDTDEIGAGIRAAAQDVHAPDALRARVDAHRAAAARSRRPARTWRPLLAGAAVALAAVVVVVAVLMSGVGAGGSVSPTVADAGAAALRPATGPAPPRDAARPSLLRVGVGGARFPEWEYALRWHATGVRHDTLAGRQATTVVYDGPGGRRVGYAIVAAPALDVPAAGRVVQRDGVRYTVVRQDGVTVVTWRRGGNTCVLAGHGVPAGRLIALAAWRPAAA